MRFLLIILIISLSLGSNAQDSLLNTILIKTFSGEINNFEVDNLGNIYQILQNNQIKKYNLRGDSVAVYNDIKRYGNIYSLDVTNPLKILVYFKDYSTIIVLDRFLNVVNTIDLRNLNIQLSSAVGLSYDNNIWVFDDFNSKLKKIDDTGNLLLESTDFRQVFDTVPNPSAIFDRDGQLYIFDEKKGLIVFDYYGAKKSGIQLTQCKDLQIIDKNTITGRSGDKIIVYKPAALQSYLFSIPGGLNSYSKINFSGKRFYGLAKKHQLNIYEVVLRN